MEPARRRYADPPEGLPPVTSSSLPLTLIGYWEYGPAGDPVGSWERVLVIGGLEA
jgi:hypothetical protein